MKKLVLSLLLLCSPCFGARLVWDYPVEWAGRLGGFHIWKRVGQKWEPVADTGTNQTWTVSLPAGMYTLAVTASGKNAFDIQSDWSDPLDIAIMVAVINLRVVQP